MLQSPVNENLLTSPINPLLARVQEPTPKYRREWGNPGQGVIQNKVIVANRERMVLLHYPEVLATSKCASAILPLEATGAVGLFFQFKNYEKMESDPSFYLKCD